ncbi:MAG: DUF2891 family protein [Deltaproteobacteria bacterium]|nr:DUF2891 family protein [Nannocystaceae bacterium]
MSSASEVQSALCLRLAATIEQTIATTSPHATGSGGGSGPTGLFGGNFDYHSSIHAHWALLGLYRMAGDAEALTRTLARVSEARLAAEVEFLDANPSFELPYGRAWLLLLYREIAADPSRDTAVLRALRRAGELELLAWLEANTAAAADDTTIGMHPSWLFALLLLLLSTPVAAGVGPRIDALYDDTVATHRAGWRMRATLANDFLHIPSIIDTLDLLRGRPAQLTATSMAASRVSSVADGHAVGEEMTRLWPLAILARTDPAMSQRFDQGLGEWLLNPERWEFGPTQPTRAWQTRFHQNSHWTPQFLWMVMRLRG